MAQYSEKVLRSLVIRRGDITAPGTDAVVNAANSSLAEGSGVCGALFAAAGSRRLTEACRAIGGCPTGKAVITPAFGLKNARFIIHAVGPDCRRVHSGKEALLRGAYESALQLAVENGCPSVGFPLLSAGIFGYPEEEAWEVALRSCLDFLAARPETELQVVFVRRSEEQVSTGRRILQRILAE